MEKKINLRMRDLWPVALVVGLFLVYSWWLLADSPSFTGAIQDQGKFGDSFGALTSLFNGLAFAGLIITILLQSRELTLQRQELQETRTQIESQADSLKSQNELSFFFELVRERRELIAAFRHHSVNSGGREGLAELMTNFRDTAGKVGATHAMNLGNHMKSYMSGYEHVLGPLVGVNMEMLKLLSRLEEDAHTRHLANRLSDTYANLLSVPELGVLFYFGLTGDRANELSILLEHHAIFRNRERDSIIRYLDTRQLNVYTHKAYARDSPWP